MGLAVHVQKPVIIVHYHLGSGGVTRVIENQAKALSREGIPYLILSGETYMGDETLEVSVIPGLGYRDEAENITKDGKDLFDQCLMAIVSKFPDDDVTWLIHNPTLGKNILWPILLTHISTLEQGILLQCHDFAEDGRALNYQRVSHTNFHYPIASHIHYAFINSRDQGILEEAGLTEENSHLLPNAISPPNVIGDYHIKPGNLLLYPVRGIRRKNIGEVALWSLLAPSNTQFAITLKPENEQWLPYYEMWKEFSEELSLPIQFGVVGNTNAPGQSGKSFEDWLQGSTHCITTSIAEGFGLTYLEPLSLNIPLIGRDLPEITKDFKEKGCELGQLYTSILIPASLVNSDLLKEDLINGLETSYLSYQAEYDHNHLARAWFNLDSGGYLDFGNLPEHHQVSVLQALQKDPSIEIFVQLEKGSLLPAKSWFADALAANVKDHQNALQDYSLVSYGQKLLHLLNKTRKSEVSDVTWLSTQEILKTYLAPERFHFLKV